jgi:hypothetical protein
MNQEQVKYCKKKIDELLKKRLGHLGLVQRFMFKTKWK